MNLSNCNQQIRSLTSSIEQELTRLLPGSSLPKADSPKYEELFQKFGAWTTRIDLLVRDLSATLHLLKIEEDQIQSVPRSQRFSAQQSVGDRMQGVDEALQAVENLKIRLKALIDRAVHPTHQEMIALVAEVCKKFYTVEELQNKTEHQMQELTLQPASFIIEKPTPTDLLASLAVVGQIMRMFAMRLAKNRTNRSAVPETAQGGRVA